MINPLTLVAGSGAVAVVMAGWQQAKVIFGYLTAFVIVRADLDNLLKHPVQIYLRKTHSILPSGLLMYIGSYMSVKNYKNHVLVPFRTFGTTIVFFKWFRFCIMNVTDGSAMLISIRGLYNFDKMIIDALNMQIDRTENTPRNYSRYQLVRCIGREKGIGTELRNSKDDASDPTSGQVGVRQTCSKHGADLDLSFDRSFMYDHSDYTLEDKDDAFTNLYFPSEITKYIDQAEQWIQMGDWYMKRNIPWRRGWLLHGPGGTGKSSLAKGVAQKLKLPIYQFFLATLSDQEFIREWNKMVTPCVALFEDFDTVFDKRKSLTIHQSLTFDTVLNQISGVGSVNGIFLIVTTNHLDKIDPAMGVDCGRDGISTRPGRVDSVIEVGNINRENRLKMANQILMDWTDQIPAIVDQYDDVTPIQFQEMCVQLAFSLLSQEEDNRSRMTSGPARVTYPQITIRDDDDMPLVFT